MHLQFSSTFVIYTFRNFLSILDFQSTNYIFTFLPEEKNKVENQIIFIALKCDDRQIIKRKNVIVKSIYTLLRSESKIIQPFNFS